METCQQWKDVQLPQPSRHQTRHKDYESYPIDRDTLETSDVVDGGAELFLYQAGYLTIKGHEDGLYLLGIPNHEVRKALYKSKGLVDWKEV